VPEPDRADFRLRWSELHGGLDPVRTPLVGSWLAVSYRLARPLARHRVPPNLVTLTALPVAAGVVALCALGGRWALAATGAVVLAGLLDGLDGAVAILAGRASPFGAVLDSLVDRLVDLALLAALWLVGAPGVLCAVAGVGLLLLEYARARATAVGMLDVGIVTVGERPTRLIIAAAFLLVAGLFPASASRWAAAGADATAAVSCAGLVQLLVVVRRRLR
jgi:phosphatidylglycerophosphate synthase